MAILSVLLRKRAKIVVEPQSSVEATASPVQIARLKQEIKSIRSDLKRVTLMLAGVAKRMEAEESKRLQKLVKSAKKLTRGIGWALHDTNKGNLVDKTAEELTDIKARLVRLLRQGSEMLLSLSKRMSTQIGKAVGDERAQYAKVRDSAFAIAKSVNSLLPEGNGRTT